MKELLLGDADREGGWRARAVQGAGRQLAAHHTRSRHHVFNVRGQPQVADRVARGHPKWHMNCQVRTSISSLYVFMKYGSV